MHNRVAVLLLPLLFTSVVTTAGTQQVEMELLEFLGEFEVSAGETLDPMVFSGEKEAARDEKEPVKRPPQQGEGMEPDGKEVDDGTTPRR